MAERLVFHSEEVQRLRLARDLRVSYKRLHGWEPLTIQRGYDQHGERVPIAEAFEIVTETEVEWDDEERTQMRALMAYESDICECGFHRSLTSDKSNLFEFNYSTCNVCRGLDRWRRIEADQAQKSPQAEQPASAPRSEDGRKLSIRQLSSLEVMARRTATNS